MYTHTHTHTHIHIRSHWNRGQRFDANMFAKTLAQSTLKWNLKIEEEESFLTTQAHKYMYSIPHLKISDHTRAVLDGNIEWNNRVLSVAIRQHGNRQSRKKTFRLIRIKIDLINLIKRSRLSVDLIYWTSMLVCVCDPPDVVLSSHTRTYNAKV